MTEGGDSGHLDGSIKLGRPRQVPQDKEETMSDDIQKGSDQETQVEALSFEEAFDQLQSAVEQLEGGDLTLEEAIALYEQGMRLARHCSDLLDTAELQVQQLGVAGDRGQMAMFFEGEEG
jgi:exodeoxyribonuclease VII small subunit